MPRGHPLDCHVGASRKQQAVDRRFIERWGPAHSVNVADQLEIPDRNAAAIVKPKAGKPARALLAAMEIALDADARAVALDGKSIAALERDWAESFVGRFGFDAADI